MILKELFLFCGGLEIVSTLGVNGGLKRTHF